jgi:hypothetical protein
MKITGILGVLGLWLLWGLATGSAQVRDTQDSALVPEGMEVLAHGPVHEAFAQPSLRRQGAAPIVPQKPPEPIPELPSEQRPDADNAVWIPGYWAWDEEREGFFWVTGVWRIQPPGHTWVPGYWLAANGGSRWVSGFWAMADQTNVELLPTPPDPVPEVAPPAPEPEAVYVPGIWVWRETRYWWRPGYWVTYRPGWVWTTACYTWTPAGYIFVDGHWDHDLAHRGLLFPPVYFTSPLYTRAGWYHRPHYAVQTPFLLTSLFVRLPWNHYYFGDYYDARYSRRGFIPWVDFRIGQHFHDPLYNYSRWQHRDDRRWEENLRSVYVARREGKMARPPRTLAEQIKAKGKAETLAVLAPVSQLKTEGFKLRPVAKDQLTEFRKEAEMRRAFAQKRSSTEAQLAAKGATAIATGASVKGNLDIPKRPSQGKQAQGKQGAEGKAPPPPPPLPKAEPRPEKAGGEKSPGKKVEPKGEKSPPKDAKPQPPKADPKGEKAPPKDTKPQPPKADPKGEKAPPRDAKPQPPKVEPKGEKAPPKDTKPQPPKAGPKGEKAPPREAKPQPPKGVKPEPKAVKPPVETKPVPKQEPPKQEKAPPPRDVKPSPKQDKAPTPREVQAVPRQERDRPPPPRDAKPAPPPVTERPPAPETKSVPRPERQRPPAPVDVKPAPRPVEVKPPPRREVERPPAPAPKAPREPRPKRERPDDFRLSSGAFIPELAARP